NEIYKSRDSLIVVAGAGSGKTRVLVEKYIDVFREDPSLVIDQVVAMTFTEKAAREMKERVMKIAQEGLASDPKNEVYQKIKRDLAFARISTIHSFCARLLRESALYINIDPDFKIISGLGAARRINKFIESYIIENVKEIKKIFETDPKIKFADLRNWLLQVINKRVNGELPQMDGEIKEIFKEHANKILESYEKMEREESVLDFEDLLIFTRDFLKENDDLRERYANYFRYIFIDEFQDTNRIQSEIIELLRSPINRVWYIGDPKQSIYAFRGADVDVFLEIIEKSHEKSVFLKEMNENHRSKPNLVKFYNQFFSKVFNERIKYSPQISKEEKDEEKRVILLDNPGDTDATKARIAEAEAICGLINDFVESGRHLSDIAILLKKTTNIWVIENALVKYGIQYHIVGGKNFFDKKEVVAVENLIGVILDPYDQKAMTGLLISPFFDMNIDEILNLKIEYPSLYDGLKAKYPEIHELIEKLLKLKNITDASKLIRMAIRETNYLGKIAIEKDGDKRIANVLKFIEILDTMDIPSWDISSVHSILDKGFGEDEQEASVLSEKEDVVKIMTVHKAKGLEFPIVIIAQMDTKLQNGDKTEKDLEEEKRLLYVAMTRAKEYLVLSKEINFKGNSENVWINTLSAAGFQKENRWQIPKGMEELVEIRKAKIPQPKNKSDEKFEFEDKYLRRPEIFSSPKMYNVTELFENEIQSQRMDYGNIAHEILEKVGPYKLADILKIDFFTLYPKEMVEEVKGILLNLVNHPIVKEIENSTVASEIAIETEIPGIGNVIGKIDKVTKDRIIDFKYAAFSSSRLKDYEFQIKFYLLSYKKLTNQKLNGAIFFLKDGKIWNVEYPDEDKLIDEIKKRINR
ncbi:MAG: UvrD-helicase domain-containing protein, partial [Athalassotoga sp.]|uniref:UvrD-helicase domain-containing protein n=2 Tax=Athalassotoga sp. TaxID=2022597 RepID=UPI003CFD87CF